MKLHKEAYPTVFFASVVFALSNVAIWRLFDDYPLVSRIYFYISLIILGLIFYFFRIPIETKPVGKNVLVSPAYGKVIAIVNEEEKRHFNQKKKRVSIFMSPFDIHANFVPFDGEVISMDYYPGKYLVAFHPKSSELNEHTFTVIKGERFDVGVKQIAGFLARRVVPYLKPNQKVEQNQELGFIKFGSRVDVFLPPDKEIKVKVGDRVKGGHTVICDL